MNITEMPLTLLAEALRRGETTSREITQAYLAHIVERDGQIGAYITVDGEKALRQAERCDAQRASGQACGPLHGVPMALKDNLCVAGGRTTCASRMLENFVSPYSATVWERLEGAGCVLLGKTNMDEFAMGSTTENSAFYPTRNPADETRVPGGSSGGSAAAVAAGEAAFALGSDTGGSIRQPAAFCGVVGMKPTYGLVSRYGLVAFASSLDVVGPMSRTVADNALVLEAIAGHDRRDTTSLTAAHEPYPAQLGRGVKGLRIGLAAEMLADGASREVRDAVLRAAQALRDMGAQVREVKLPSMAHALPAYYVLSSAEASSNLARYDGVRYGRRAVAYDDLEDMYVRSRTEGFGAEVRRRILLGTYALSAGYVDQFYRKAQQVRTLIRQDFARVFGEVDCLLAPVAPTTAWKLGEKRTDPVETYGQDVYCVPASLAGIPALSLPFGMDAQGLPVGIQLMGPALSEGLLYRVGHALEEVRD